MAYSYFCPGPFPTAVQDMVNTLPPEFQKSTHICDLFEAIIVANTADDEPNAPKITFRNPVDDQPCPKLEFYYTNKLFHGPDVSPPNPLNLQGCSCKGRCDPNDETCACVQRQGKIIKTLPDFESFAGFLYDDQGYITELGLPIFECNAACSCSSQCMNRVRNSTTLYTNSCPQVLKVAQKGRKIDISIRKTPKKGWGESHSHTRMLGDGFNQVYSQTV
jgi:[histone H3]-lysine9 N-trimethyltransferase SUV39H